MRSSEREARRVLADRLRELMRPGEWTPEELARHMGLWPRDIRRLLAGGRAITLRTRLLLCRAMGVAPDAFDAVDLPDYAASLAWQARALRIPRFPKTARLSPAGRPRFAPERLRLITPHLLLVCWGPRRTDPWWSWQLRGLLGLRGDRPYRRLRPLGWSAVRVSFAASMPRDVTFDRLWAARDEGPAPFRFRIRPSSPRRRC